MRKYEAYKDSGIEWIGEIPSHWDTKRIRHIADIFGRIGYRGYTVEDIVFDESGAISLSPSNIENQKLTLESVTRITQEKYEESPEIMVYENDVVLVKTASVGKAAIIRSLNDLATINPQLVVFKNYRIDQIFFYYEIISRIIQAQITQDLNGGVVNTITQTNLNNYSIIIPPPEEQTVIAHYLDRKTVEIDELIADKKRLLELYEEEKTAVINQAVTKGINPDAPMKGSGIEWLGEIPEHWGVPNMKYVCEFILDGTHGSFARVESGYRLLSVRNIINDQFVFRDDDSKVSEKDFYEISKRFLIQLNDIQLAIVGATLGKVAIVKALPEPFVTQRSVATLRANEKCIPEYLFYFLKSSNFQSFLWLNAGFSAQPGIYLGTIQNSSMPLPDIEEQQNIVNRIKTECDRINSKKSKTQKLIELLTEYRTALISEVVTGKVKVTADF
ncbi:restriction endonuclease subunit S [Sunxiuqinia dokdonensis]|uniref:Type I restriction modification DNA specificity domain-containing protein n=1 Tax=Sunxiuqinia dokdonensis TaxID=1409788 RepID=A0A0L8V8B1_9BACT|nr:restriction endonuclease subunit S [Sunxiuqinia dokdonensis]KOH44603.1 hypothetical protein NC99_25880 [Sunxiuqinia dokdonensis]